MGTSRVLIGALFIASLTTGPVFPQGVWTFEPVGEVGARTDLFYAVEGTGMNDVWAVGYWQPPDTDQLSLIEHFDGNSWTKFPTPDTGVVGPFESLHGVAAISADRAVAVGSYTPSGSTGQPLAMEWDGTEWSLMPTPDFSGGGVFRDIDVTPSGEVWAAGFILGTAFLARSSGGDWNLEWAPQVGSGRNRFYAVHAFRDDKIWAAGIKGAGPGDFEILIQRYNGGGDWTSFDIPTPGWMDDLWGIQALASDDVWAAGSYYDPNIFRVQPLLMHYDGGAWTKLNLPPFLDGSAELRGLTAAAPNDIYAAGTYATEEGVPRPFMLHYDGIDWTEVAIPPTGGSHEWFRGMGTTPDGSVWAVGQYYDGTTTEPLAFRKTGLSASVGEGRGGAPAMLSQAAPNPFGSATSVRFNVRRPDHVRLQIWDSAGRLVRTLVHREMPAGSHSVSWDGADARGTPVPTGVYFYRLDVSGRVERQKVIRIR